jgi:hypothetical protein
MTPEGVGPSGRLGGEMLDVGGVVRHRVQRSAFVEGGEASQDGGKGVSVVLGVEESEARM